MPTTRSERVCSVLPASNPTQGVEVDVVLSDFFDEPDDDSDDVLDVVAVVDVEDPPSPFFDSEEPVDSDDERVVEDDLPRLSVL